MSYPTINNPGPRLPVPVLLDGPCGCGVLAICTVGLAVAAVVIITTVLRWYGG